MTHFRAAAATVVYCVFDWKKQMPIAAMIYYADWWPVAAAAAMFVVVSSDQIPKISPFSCMHFNGSQFYAVSFNGLALHNVFAHMMHTDLHD